MQRSRDDAEDDLGWLFPLLYRIVDEAWAIFAAEHRFLRGDYPLRAQATLVHTYMEKVARTILEGMPGVNMPPPGTQGFYIEVDNRWRIRLRKLNTDFSVCNNSTKITWEFATQQDEQLGLPAMPEPVTSVYVGYLLNGTKSGMASAHVVCPDNEENYRWELTLLPPAEEPPVQLPVAPSSPDGPQDRRRATPKPHKLPQETPAKDESGA